MNQEDVKFFTEYKDICSAYGIAQGTMYFDITTIAPKAGVPYRNRMLSILAGEAFAYQMDPKHIQRLEKLYQEAEADSELKKELALYFRMIEDVRLLPKDVFVEQQLTIADSQSAWEKAKHDNDFALFAPHLKKVIAMQKKVLSYVDKNCSDYDYLLDRYQQGTNTALYDNFFQQIKDKLLPLIKRIQQEGRPIDNSILFQSYPQKEQEAFMEDLKDYLQVDRNECYMATSEHPFTQFFSAHEARITTHYYEHNLISAILSTIHEYGHALYSLQVDAAYDGTAFKDAIGYAMHESQSRFMENHIGRSHAFWEVNYPKLQKYFSKQLQDVSVDAFVDMMNVARPSLIRTEADELTYPIHILIRYELEKEIFSGDIEPEELEAKWNAKYEEYLGIRPEQSSKGILQDMHWGASNLGYFPTYALGSAYAAQFYHAMAKQLDVEAILRSGDFQQITNWLKEHIHHYGASLSADEILQKATGETFNPNYYIDYLINKYTRLYAL